MISNDRRAREQMRKLFTVGVMLIGSLYVVGCVSIETQTGVSVWSYDKTTEIRISVPTSEINFNWHGGGWYNASRSYKLSMPRGKSLIEGSEIVLKRNEETLTIASSSTVTIEGTQPCMVSINLRNSMGKPYEFNGNYKDLLCRK